MKKTIITLGAVAVSALSVNAQGLVAGWDFADVTNLNADFVNGYAAEKTAFNNSVATSGQIYTDGSFTSSNLAQNTETVFFSAGAAAGAPGFGDGFSQLTTQTPTDPATGQQSLSFTAPGTSFTVVFGFTLSENVVINFDFWNDTTGVATDILNVRYSSDGVSFTDYEPANNSYWAGGSQSWVTTNSTRGGLVDVFNSGQGDGVVDLTSAGQVAFVALDFANLGAGELVLLDNVHVAGTAVPEPSAYAAIAGALALAFVAARRRR